MQQIPYVPMVSAAHLPNHTSHTFQPGLPTPSITPDREMSQDFAAREYFPPGQALLRRMSNATTLLPIQPSEAHSVEVAFKIWDGLNADMQLRLVRKQFETAKIRYEVMCAMIIQFCIGHP